MEARIMFLSEIYIEGDSIEEIREQFEEMPMFTVEALDCYAATLAVTEVTDPFTEKDLTDDWAELDDDDDDEEEEENEE